MRRRVSENYDAGQAWIVVTLVGAAIGLNAAFLNIVTEWLADVKLGWCETAFYLNESFCCWGAENGEFWVYDLGRGVEMGRGVLICVCGRVFGMASLEWLCAD